jgi:hypothetical protein
MKAKETSSESIKKLIYYVDESIVFIITVLAIIFSDSLQAVLRGELHLHHGLFFVSWTKIIASSFIAVMLYGVTNNTFKYSDKDKPSIFKRIYTSVMLGIAWKSVIGGVTILN